MARIEGEPGGASAPVFAVAAEDALDLTAADVEVIPPAIVSQSLGQYLRAWTARLRGGDAGVLPVALALVAVVVVFTIVSKNHVFLSAGNLVNLFDQSAVFIVLAIGEGFVLLLGEIDLSIGYVAAIGGIVAAQLVQPQYNWPWWAAIIAALVVCGAIGALQGSIITRLRMPAFIVTLAGYLMWFGVMIYMLGAAGGVGITSTLWAGQVGLYGIVYSYIDPLVAWIGLIAIVGVLGSAGLGDRRPPRRARHRGDPQRPLTDRAGDPVAVDHHRARPSRCGEL